MRREKPTFFAIVIKTAVTHAVTYFIVGLLAATLLDYGRFFAETSLNVMMRPIDDPWVMAGPLFQPLRGLLFGLVFYLLREPLFNQKRGWLALWVLLVFVGIVGAFGPAPGSLEGLIYTIFPLWVHLRGLPEVLLQTFLLAVISFYWLNQPQKKWLSWTMGAAFVIMMALPALGLLVTASP